MCRRKKGSLTLSSFYLFYYVTPLGYRLPSRDPVIQLPNFLPCRSLCSWCVFCSSEEKEGEKGLYM